MNNTCILHMEFVENMFLVRIRLLNMLTSPKWTEYANCMSTYTRRFELLWNAPKCDIKCKICCQVFDLFTHLELATGYVFYTWTQKCFCVSPNPQVLHEHTHAAPVLTLSSERFGVLKWVGVKTGPHGKQSCLSVRLSRRREVTRWGLITRTGGCEANT